MKPHSNNEHQSISSATVKPDDNNGTEYEVNVLNGLDLRNQYKRISTTHVSPEDLPDTSSVLLTKMYSVQSHTSFFTSSHLLAHFHPPLMCLIWLSSDSQPVSVHCTQDALCVFWSESCQKRTQQPISVITLHKNKTITDLIFSEKILLVKFDQNKLIGFILWERLSHPQRTVGLSFIGV